MADRNPRGWLWMVAGAMGLLVAVLCIWHYRTAQNPVALLAARSRAVELVQRMRLDLARASEAEKSAVMAVTDEESETFADQSRAASRAVEEECIELGRLLSSDAPEEEKHFSAFSSAFVESQAIDTELLGLAVKNTNLKAYSLAFGPAAEAVGRMDEALSRLIAQSAESTSANSRQVLQLTGEADIGALRIEAALPAHISEENDERMNARESSMAADDRHVRSDLLKLDRLVAAAQRGDLQAAEESYGTFSDLRTQIIKLSRENTNVRSLTISLNQKRLADLRCQEALVALERAIQNRRVPEAPANPR